MPLSLLIQVLKRLALSVATIEQVERTVVMRVSGNVTTSPVFMDFNCGIIGCFISLFIVLFIFLLTLRCKNKHYIYINKTFWQFFYKKFIKFTIMDKKLMLEQLISHFTDGNKAQFAAKIGISPQNLSQWLNRGTFDAEIIFANCEGISSEWLLSGRNEMLLQNQQNGNYQQNGNTKQNGNAEILALCCELVANYRQRDAVMAKLVEILG